MSGKSKAKIGILGGTFNPIHLGHTHLARAAADLLGLQRVLLIPAGNPPHKAADLAPAADRLAMARLAAEGDDLFEVCDVEVRRVGVSYTIDTLKEIRERSGPDTEYTFLIGADTIRELPGWRSIEELLTICRFVAVSRPGDELAIPPDLEVSALPIEGRDISSTDIRRRVAASQPLDGLVAPAVAAYIQSNRLYAS